MTRDLKQLETLKTKAQDEVNDYSKQIEALVQKRKESQTMLSDIQKQINEILSEVVVSEHAILRYFERVLGYDIEDIKNKILPEEIKPKIKELTNCEYPVDGFYIVSKNNKIVTVVKK